MCCSRDRSLAFSRPAIVSVSRASSPNEVMFTCLISFSHLSHLSSRLSEDVQSSGPAESLAYPSKRDRAVPVTEPLFHELLRTARSSRRQHTVESFDTSCPFLAVLLVSLQYPSCSIVKEHSVCHATARVEQQTHGVHLRSLVLTSRHHHSPLHGILQLEGIVFPVQSRLISREMHISAESREQRHCLNNQEPPRPNGKLGSTSESFPQYNELGSVRHECELQSVLTS